VIYEMLTKQPPFIANNPVAVAYKHVHEMPSPPSVKRRDTPKRLELIVLKALKKDKKDRYASAEEMLEHLDTVDVNELVDKTTISFAVQKARHTESKPNEGITDKRITDRRSGERRGFARTPGKFILTDKEYWLNLLAHQWLSIGLIAALAIILILHILQK